MKAVLKLILALLLLLLFGLALPIKASAWSSVKSTWTISTVDSLSYYPSLKLDSQGHPHISYHAIGSYDLKYAVLKGDSWATTMVDSKDNIGYTPSLELDSKDRPHISYSESSIPIGDSRYAFWNGNSWIITTVDLNGSVSSSMKLDSNDEPHICYTDNSLKYVVWNGNSWISTTVYSDDSVGEYADLALDSDDRPHISFYTFYANRSTFERTNVTLKYARFTGSNWEIMTIDSDVNDVMVMSLALDSDDRPHISYCGSMGQLKYAVLENNNWNITPIDPTCLVGFHSSLALDSNNRPHISYQDSKNHILKYARFTGINWEIMTVESGLGRVEAPTSLVLDSNNQPHISYTTNSNLKYAVLEDAVVVSSPPLREPLNLQATVDKGNIMLSWNAPETDGVPPVTNYKIYRGNTSGSEAFLAVVGNVTTYIDATVESGATYYYQVSAVNSEGEGAKSNETSAIMNELIIQANSFYVVCLLLALILGLIVIVTIIKKAKSKDKSG